MDNFVYMSQKQQVLCMCVVDSMVYVDTVNNSNNTWHVQICVVDSMVYMGTVNNSNNT